MTQAAESAPRSRQRAGADAPLDLPDRRVFWQWVWSAIRPIVGWALAIAGAVALFVGWWGVSGEALTSKQIPYLVSAGLTGVALFILAGVFLATDDIRRQFGQIAELQRKVDDLYALFAADIAAGESDSVVTGIDPPAYVALPTGSSYHRPDCALVAGKREAAPTDAAAVRDRGLSPCRVCSPGRPTA
ncbi:MAG: hypothetical protein QOC82_1119 [Frankiaceae bacterium]|jgi:hypothetical protein|nr:hypothetical protein [Frankiaceae bacterium]